MNNIIRISILTILAAFTIALQANAEGYGAMKQKASEGASDVYSSFQAAAEKGVVETTPLQSVDNDYASLIDSYKAAAAKDPLDGLLNLFPVVSRERLDEFMAMSDADAETLLASGISEDELVGLVIARSPRIQDAFESWKAALKLYPETLFIQDLLDRFSSFTGAMDLGIGKEYQKSMIQMNYPGPGMIALRGQAVDADTDAAYQAFLATGRDVIADTRALLAKIEAMDEHIDINGRSATLLGTLRDVANAQYKAGTRSFADLIRFETEHAQRLDKVNRLRSQRDGMLSQLASYLNLPTGIEFGDIAWSPGGPETLPEKELRDGLPESRQELVKMSLMLTKMDSMIAMSNLRAAPDKTFGMTYFQGRDVDSLYGGGMQSAEGDDMSGMGGSDMGKMKMGSMDFMTDPMVDFRNNNYASDTAWAAELVNRRAATARSLQSMTDMAYGMFDMLALKYKQAIDSEKVYAGKVVPDAQAALDVVRTGYSSDEYNFNDLIGAELSLLMAKMDLVDIRLDRRTSLIELERLVGKDLRGGVS